MKRIEYKSANGYSGVLYGKSSMIIRDPEGKEILHTGSRIPNTLYELMDIVDTIPKFMKIMEEMINKMQA